jgi:protein-tyrosine-phosphatase
MTLEKKVLFICSANYNRSVMAEAIYNHLSKSQKAHSAAVYDYGIVGWDTSNYVKQVLAEKGITLQEHKVRLWGMPMIEQAKGIYILTQDISEELNKALEQCASKVKQWDIPDPQGTYDIEKYREARDVLWEKIASEMQKERYKVRKSK